MKPFLRLFRLLGFAAFFVREVLVSNLRLARDILRPAGRLRPGLIELPVSLATDRQRWILATCISMTPGTLSLRLVEERGILLIHTLHADEGPALVADLKARFERRIADAF